MKKDIQEIFSGLTFTEEDHKYYLQDKQFKKSVSGVIEEFEEPFDTELMSSLVAKRDGKTKEQVQKEWKDISDKACELGTRVHLFGELYMFDRSLKPQNGYERAIVNFWNDVPEHVIPYIAEIQMYHKEYMFAGTADILLYNEDTNTFIIGDLKTNKDLYKNYKGKKLLKPFDNLLDNPFNHYQIQLSLYQMCFEQTGFKVSSRKIIWLLPDGTYQLYDTEDYTKVLKEYLDKNPVC